MKHLKSFNENNHKKSEFYNKIKNNLDEVEKKMKEFKEDPDSARTGVFYKAKDGSKIEALHEDDDMIFGVIVESPIKPSIGLTGNWAIGHEVKKIINE